MITLPFGFAGVAMYVSRPAIVTCLPFGVPLWMFPLRQQAPEGLARYASDILISLRAGAIK